MPKTTHDLKLIENHRLGASYHHLVFEAPEPIPPVLPGQFAEILVPGAVSTFLRRPFSVFDVDYTANTLQFIVKIAGDGTRKLCSLPVSSSVNIIYPLGSGFSLSTGKSLIVGGGVGIAPMYLLSKWLYQQNKSFDILLGGRTSADIIKTNSFAQYGHLGITTEDGSVGYKGLITHHPWMQHPEENYARIYTCGPEPMMRAVAKIASEASVSCEVSLENTMACGYGVCLCCIVATHKGNLCVCTEGPVFNINALIGW